MIKVSQWMTRNPITIDEEASVIEAIHLMKEKNIRRVPVMRGDRFVGLVTDRMIKEYTPGKATALDTWEVHYLLAKTAVKDVMNAHPYTVTPETSLSDACKVVLDKKLYGLCVVDEQGDLVGLMSTSNLMRAVIDICNDPRLAS